jgi:hypothetical protein
MMMHESSIEKIPDTTPSASNATHGETQISGATWNTLYAQVAARLGEDGKQISKTTLLTEVIERLSISETAVENLKQSAIKDKMERLSSQSSILNELQTMKLGLSRYVQSLGGIGKVELSLETKLLKEGILDEQSRQLDFLSESSRNFRNDLAVISQQLEEAREESRTAAAEARSVKADLDHRLQMHTASRPIAANPRHPCNPLRYTSLYPDPLLLQSHNTRADRA